MSSADVVAVVKNDNFSHGDEIDEEFRASTDELITNIENALKNVQDIFEIIRNEEDFTYSESTCGIVCRALQLKKTNVVLALLEHASCDMEEMDDIIEAAKMYKCDDIMDKLVAIRVQKIKAFHDFLQDNTDYNNDFSDSD